MNNLEKMMQAPDNKKAGWSKGDRLKNLKNGKSKYGNKRCEYDGFIFDSLAEREYYKVLKATMEDMSLVSFQERFVILDGFEIDDKRYRPIHYRPDFVIRDEEGNIKEVIDVKGVKTDTFRLKAKLFMAKYKIPITLVVKRGATGEFKKEIM